MTGPAAGMRPPKCSIGLPVYNGAEYVGQAIEAVLRQDFTDLELIISDNASTDRTAEICKRFAEVDPRIIYVRQPRNIGAAKNYNHVFHLARGSYFVWLAHDDVHGPDFLSTCLKGFEDADGDTILVYPSFRYIDETSSEIEDEVPSCVHTDAATPAGRLHDVLEGLGIVSSVFGMFRRDRLAQTRLIGSFIASDYVLLAECALLGKIVRLDSPPQFSRRLHEGGSQRANRTPDEVAKWFDPNAIADRRPGRRLSREYLQAVLFIPGLSVSDRLRALATLVVQRGVNKHRARRLRRARPAARHPS